MAKDIGEEKAVEKSQPAVEKSQPAVEKPQPAVEPTEPTTPPEADALIESGWRHYSDKEYDQAEKDFKKALDLIPDSADTMYALGMTLQAAGRTDEAIGAFEKVFPMLEDLREKNPARALMLNRLAHGHINYMRTGDWDLS